MVERNLVSEKEKLKKKSIHCKEQRNYKCHLMLSKHNNTAVKIDFISIMKSELPKKQAYVIQRVFHRRPLSE